MRPWIHVAMMAASRALRGGKAYASNQADTGLGPAADAQGAYDPMAAMGDDAGPPMPPGMPAFEPDLPVQANDITLGAATGNPMGGRPGGGAE